MNPDDTPITICGPAAPYAVGDPRCDDTELLTVTQAAADGTPRSAVQAELDALASRYCQGRPLLTVWEDGSYECSVVLPDTSVPPRDLGPDLTGPVVVLILLTVLVRDAWRERPR